jgi:hypothetical protein
MKEQIGGGLKKPQKAKKQTKKPATAGKKTAGKTKSTPKPKQKCPPCELRAKPTQKKPQDKTTTKPKQKPSQPDLPLPPSLPRPIVAAPVGEELPPVYTSTLSDQISTERGNLAGELTKMEGLRPEDKKAVLDKADKDMAKLSADIGKTQGRKPAGKSRFAGLKKKGKKAAKVAVPLLAAAALAYGGKKVLDNNPDISSLADVADKVAEIGASVKEGASRRAAALADFLRQWTGDNQDIPPGGGGGGAESSDYPYGDPADLPDSPWSNVWFPPESTVDPLAQPELEEAQPELEEYTQAAKMISRSMGGMTPDQQEEIANSPDPKATASAILRRNRRSRGPRGSIQMTYNPNLPTRPEAAAAAAAPAEPSPEALQAIDDYRNSGQYLSDLADENVENRIAYITSSEDPLAVVQSLTAERKRRRTNPTQFYGRGFLGGERHATMAMDLADRGHHEEAMALIRAGRLVSNDPTMMAEQYIKQSAAAAGTQMGSGFFGDFQRYRQEKMAKDNQANFEKIQREHEEQMKQKQKGQGFFDEETEKHLTPQERMSLLMKETEAPVDEAKAAYHQQLRENGAFPEAGFAM